MKKEERKFQLYRDSEHIDRVLNIIKKAWSENPELRLCQLIGNHFKVKDLYYIEDEEVEKMLKENINKFKK